MNKMGLIFGKNILAEQKVGNLQLAFGKGKLPTVYCQLQT